MTGVIRRHSGTAIDPEGKCTPAAPAANATSTREFTRTVATRPIARRTIAISSRAGSSLSRTCTQSTSLVKLNVRSVMQYRIILATGSWLLATSSS